MEIGTLQFWVGAIRYRNIQRLVLLGKKIPFDDFTDARELDCLVREADAVVYSKTPVGVADYCSESKTDLTYEMIDTYSAPTFDELR